MTFEEAQARSRALWSRWQARQLTPQAYHAELATLRVQDAGGVWWQPEPSTGGWLRWDGRAWVAGVRAPGPPAAAGGPRIPVAAAAPSRLRAATVDPASFLRESRGVPLARRSQKWWDTAAILGGVASGYLWFLYGSVRGFPKPRSLSSYDGTWFDLLPTAVLAALPILAYMLRKPLARMLSGGMARVAVLLGMAGAGWWLNNDTSVLYRHEPLDFITPLLMMALPIVFVTFRSEIDRVLGLLQPLRRVLPRMLIVVLGLAAPYGVAMLLYNRPYTEYPYFRMSVLVGTFVSYAILRTPQGRALGPAARVAALVGVALAWFLLGTGEAFADDFLRDPFNLNDGLRTPGAAPILAGTATTVVTVLVNGVEVVRTVLVDPAGPSKDGKAEHKQFQVVVDTVDALGARCTCLDSAEHPQVFVYAHCEEVGKGRFPAGDPTIRYSLLSAQPFVSLTDMGMAHGRRCASLKFVEPLGQTQPPESFQVLVQAGAEAGGLVSATITLQLRVGLQMVVKIEGEGALSDGCYPIRFKAGPPGQKGEWDPKPLKVYFRKPGADAPVPIDFQPAWEPVQAEPADLLDFDPPRTGDRLTWTIPVCVRPGAVMDEDWLIKNGRVKIRVRCREQRT